MPGISGDPTLKLIGGGKRQVSVVGVRPMAPADLEAIVEIQVSAPEIAQWQAGAYTGVAAEPGGMVLVAEHMDCAGVAGFLAARCTGPEAEIRNLAVRAECRRKGVGRRMVEEAHRRLAAKGTERVFLEVRPSNLAARRLYSSLGYTECGVRRHYYQSDGEDALVLELALRPGAGGVTPAAGITKTD